MTSQIQFDPWTTRTEIQNGKPVQVVVLMTRRQARKARVRMLLAMRVEAEAARRDRPQNMIEA